MGARRTAVHVVDRQQQVTEGPNGTQYLVRHYFYVGTYLVHELQEREAVERANGMVRDDHHTTTGGNARPFFLAQPQAEVEVAQGLLDEIEAAQMRVVAGKLLEAAFVKEETQEARERTRHFPVLVYKVGIAFLEE